LEIPIYPAFIGDRPLPDPGHRRNRPLPFQGNHLSRMDTPGKRSEVQALTGSGFITVYRLLNVSYYNNTHVLGNPGLRQSITPAVDFDLNTYQGTNSPDASAGVVSTGLRYQLDRVHSERPIWSTWFEGTGRLHRIST